MKKVNIGLLLVTAGLALNAPALDPVHAQAKSRVRGDPNVPTGYVLCNDGVAIAFEIIGGGFGIKGAIDECNARHGGVAPAIANPRITASEAAPPRPDAVVNATPIAMAGPRSEAAVSATKGAAADPRAEQAQAQTTEKLIALAATPRFMAMQRARDHRGMGAALAGIGVRYEGQAAAWMLCLPPRRWIWGAHVVQSSDGSMSHIAYVQVCGNDKL